MTSALQSILANPGGLAALCLITGLVVGTNFLLFSVLRRGTSGEASLWKQALGGANARQRQQTQQLEELHRAVSELSAGHTPPDRPNG